MFGPVLLLLDEFLKDWAQRPSLRIDAELKPTFKPTTTLIQTHRHTDPHTLTETYRYRFTD